MCAVCSCLDREGERAPSALDAFEQLGGCGISVRYVSWFTLAKYITIKQTEVLPLINPDLRRLNAALPFCQLRSRNLPLSELESPYKLSANLTKKPF